MGLDHGPNQADDSVNAATTARNARLGLILFAVYSVLYGAFVLVNTFAPRAMEVTLVAGVNRAILSGFGLILIAFVLAIVYGYLCRSPVEDPPP